MRYTILMDSTADWIRRALRAHLSRAPETVATARVSAWCDGYRQALEDFAVWKDGQQWTAMGRELSPIIAALEEVAREQIATPRTASEGESDGD
jgi:hypothetical protein